MQFKFSVCNQLLAAEAFSFYCRKCCLVTENILSISEKNALKGSLEPGDSLHGRGSRKGFFNHPLPQFLGIFQKLGTYFSYSSTAVYPLYVMWENY